MIIIKTLFCLFLIFLFIPSSKSTTSVEFEPDGGNITICYDRYTDIEYKIISIESVIGQFHQNLKSNTWRNCTDCEMWYYTENKLLYKTKELDSIIQINHSIVDPFGFDDDTVYFSIPNP